MNIRMKTAVSGLGALALAVAFGSAVAFMQDRGPADGRRPGFAGRSPLVAAIDADHDGTISAAEISQAPETLKTLDRDGDGQLTADELRPAFGPRAGRRDGGGRRGPGAAGSGDDTARDGGPGFRRMDPIAAAIDADHDGTLSAAEIAGAGQALAVLDANKDGQLTADEIRPARRGRAARNR